LDILYLERHIKEKRLVKAESSIGIEELKEKALKNHQTTKED
jgi:hypothetical protein